MDFYGLPSFDGLLRFDGHVFKDMNPLESEDANGNAFAQAISDPNDSLWITTPHYIMRRNGNDFERIDIDKDDRAFFFVRQDSFFALTSDNSVWTYDDEHFEEVFHTSRKPRCAIRAN